MGQTTPVLSKCSKRRDLLHFTSQFPSCLNLFVDDCHRYGVLENNSWAYCSKLTPTKRMPACSRRAWANRPHEPAVTSQRQKSLKNAIFEQARAANRNGSSKNHRIHRNPTVFDRWWRFASENSLTAERSDFRFREGSHLGGSGGQMRRCCQ